LGAGADTYTNALNGASVVVMTGGANTVTTGTGDDTFTVGTSTDSVTGGTGTNIYNITAAAQLVANTLTITDWTTADEIQFTLAALNSGATVTNIDDGGDSDISDTAGYEVTGAWTQSGATDETIFVNVNLTAGLASSDALETALEYGGSAQMTASAALSVGDRFLAVYDDTVSTYIAMVTLNNAVADGGWAGSGTLTAVNLVKLTGIADSSTVVGADIDYV